LRGYEPKSHELSLIMLKIYVPLLALTGVLSLVVGRPEPILGGIIAGLFSLALVFTLESLYP
jgi:hypothetical protein